MHVYLSKAVVYDVRAIENFCATENVMLNVLN